MARTVRDASLDSRAARARLKPSGIPYYHAIDQGLHVGYRKGRKGGKWVARWYSGCGSYRMQTIGVADDMIDADGAAVLSFSQAQAIARQRFVEFRRAEDGFPQADDAYTVRDCIDDYVRWMTHNRKSAEDTRYRAMAHIVPVLGDVKCSRLTKQMISNWLDAMVERRPRVRTKRGGAQQYRKRSSEELAEALRKRRNTANRNLAVLKAALNHAWRDQKIASDNAWRRVSPYRDVDAARLRYLSFPEAIALMDAAEPDFRLLVRAALVTGARYGELTALRVEDLNPDIGTLHIRTSKSGKARHVVLTEEGQVLFSRLAAGRRTTDFLLRKADGTPWLTAHQLRPMLAASRAAGIAAANFHCLRHTFPTQAFGVISPLPG